jgi:two-component system, response regulator
MTESDHTDILLIEDNPRDAEMTIRALGKGGVTNRIRWSRDGVDALAWLLGEAESGTQRRLHLPRLILLDLKLPRLDGLEVLRRLKRHDRTRTIPAVILSSSREDPDIARAYALGVNSYIVKPVEFENFAEAVAQVGLYWLVVNEPPRQLPAAPDGDTTP